MASPQKEHGHVGIANEIWDEVIRRDFTKRQKDILHFIWRLSYGCNQKIAIIPKQKDFALCGVGENHIKSELNYLIECRVIFRTDKIYQFNKDYDFWQVSPVFTWDQDRFKELIHINLEEAKKKRLALPETGSSTHEENKQNTSQNGKLNEEENFPKREDVEEEKHPKTGSLEPEEEIEKLPETGTLENENFPFWEVVLPETGSSTPVEASNDAASQPSKKGFKKEIIIKDLNNKFIAQFEEFWSLYPQKNGKKKAYEKFIKLAPKLDFEKVMIGTRNYIAYCKSTNRFYKDGSTFVNQQTWDDYQEMPDGALSSNKPANKSSFDEILRRFSESE